MRIEQGRLPSPGALLAVIALIVALAGTATALPGKNKVDRNDIKKNAVKSKHIADGTVTGADVDIASLGRVPAVEGLDVIPLTRVAPSASAPTDDAAQAAATRVPLYSKGSYAIYAKCFKDVGTPGNPGVYGAIFLEAGPGTVFDADGGSNSSNGFLEPSAPEGERELQRVNSFAGVGDPGTVNISGGGDGAFWAAQGDAHLEGSVFVATKVGTPEEGNGVFGPGDACLFGGSVRSG